MKVAALGGKWLFIGSYLVRQEAWTAAVQCLSVDAKSEVANGGRHMARTAVGRQQHCLISQYINEETTDGWMDRVMSGRTLVTNAHPPPPQRVFGGGRSESHPLAMDEQRD